MTARILYVEDEVDYHIVIRRILHRAGLDLVIAETGADGLRVLERERPSLMILDINLPDMDGYALCNRLRHDPAWIDLPILMLTVRRRPDEWLRGFSSGANDYICKPVNPPEFMERLTKCLERKAHPLTPNGTGEYNLIRSVVAGNRAAFEVLIQKYRDRLSESLRNDVRNNAQLDDIVSHAFATAFEKLGEFRGEASFYTWVYRIALNESIGFYRIPRDRISLDDLADGEESLLLARAAPQESLEKIMVQEEIHRRALEALSRVAEPYRTILELFFLQDLSYEVIAKRLRIPQGTVMSRLHKARRLLQEAWLHQTSLVKQDA